MSDLLTCEFNIDTACVELCFADGSMISIDCTAVENEVADHMYQRSELVCFVNKKSPKSEGKFPSFVLGIPQFRKVA